MILKRLYVCGAVFFLISGSEAAADEHLIDAIKEADRTAVLALLGQGVDVNAQAGDGASALHWAAHRGDTEIAEELIRRGAAVNAVNDLGVTPLWIACRNRNTDIVAALLRAGADPNVGPSNGGTPLMRAVYTGDEAAVTMLLAHGARVNTSEESRGQTALMWAVARRHPEIVRVLLDSGANVHARSKTQPRFVAICCFEPNTNTAEAPDSVEVQMGGFTPLLFAAHYGEIESARLLLTAGADVNDRAPIGTTALMMAAHNGHEALSVLLLDWRADPNATGTGYTALHAAVLRKKVEAVKALLAHGANPNARLTSGSPIRRFVDIGLDKSMIGATPFLLAAKLHQVDIMAALISNGADPLLAMQDGTTPLIAAAAGKGWIAGEGKSPDSAEEEFQTLKTIELAIALGGAVNGANASGDTALHALLSRPVGGFGGAGRMEPGGFSGVIRLLVAQGARLDAKNRKGHTPLSLVLAGRQLPTGAFGIDNFLARPDFDRKATADLLRTLGAKE